MKPLLPDVTVNGVLIDPALIANEAQNHPAPQGKPGLAWQAAARALAVRRELRECSRSDRRDLVSTVACLDGTPRGRRLSLRNVPVRPGQCRQCVWLLDL